MRLRRALIAALALVVAIPACSAGKPQSKPQETTRRINLNLERSRAVLAPSESKVRGVAVFRETEDGGTIAILRARFMEPNSEARAVVNAGTCTTPGASFLELPRLRANENGRAESKGLLRFRAVETIKLTEIADGEHIVRILKGDIELACGRIPPPEQKRKREPKEGEEG